MPISREQFYREVWAEPMTKVAARYGVSSSYLARLCTTLSVPRPRRGHWAKCAVGNIPEQAPLPEATLGDAVEWSRGGRASRSDVLPTLPPKARARPTRRERPAIHGLVAGCKAHFEAGRETDDYLRSLKRKLVDIFTSKQTLDRALATADALFNALEARGYRVCLALAGSSYQRPAVDARENPGKGHYFGPSWYPSNVTVTFVGTLAIGLSLFELSEQAPVLYRGGRYVRLDSVSEGRASRYSPTEWAVKTDVPSGLWKPAVVN